jgi:hypothetical protein
MAVGWGPDHSIGRRRLVPKEGGAMQALLFDRLGGLDAIKAIVDAFVARCAGDARINGKFARTDVPRLKLDQGRPREPVIEDEHLEGALG